MKTISILGCGWLGLPLAESLIGQGYMVKGSTTTEVKLPLLTQKGIEPFQIALSETAITGDILSFLEGSEIVIIDIPPQIGRNINREPSASFVAKMERLIPYLESAKIAKVIFISSTSVYPDGELPGLPLTEEMVPNPDTESGRQLFAVEKLFQSQNTFHTTVVRLGGLIGEDRHPIRFLAGKQNLENPHAPINLIHQKDCLGILQKIIELDRWGETFNAVHPLHPTRKEYYTRKALALNLPVPEFNETKKSAGKIIETRKIAEKLGYTFQSEL